MKFNQLKLTALALICAVILASCSGGGNKEADAGSEFDSAKE